MDTELPRRIPDDPLGFIKSCVREGKLSWTYHVNMRLMGRSLSRHSIVSSVDSYEILEAYPQDKYLPSYLVFAVHSAQVIHFVCAVDVETGSIRVVTGYRPDLREWEPGLRKRRST